MNVFKGTRRHYGMKGLHLRGKVQADQRNNEGATQKGDMASPMVVGKAKGV